MTPDERENEAGIPSDIELAFAKSGPSPDNVQATSGEQREGESPVARTATNTSIAETLSLPHEIAFVGLVCMAQLTTQAGLGQALSILHIIGDSFGITDPGQLTWLIAGYSLTVGTFILFSGRLGDVFGYKRLLLIGWAWFSLWSAVAGCAIYSNYVLFIFSRVLQGIGPAICLPNGLAILGATYAPGRRKAMCFAIFGAMAPAGFLVGALFASLFSMAFWPWAFWAFSIALAGLAVAGIFIIPDPPRKFAAAMSLRGRMEQLDIPGAVTGVAALVLFNFAWNQAPIDGWQAPHVIVMLILGVLLGVVFFILETRYSPQPLIPFEIFSSDVSFVLAALALGWSCFGVFVYYLWQFEEVLLGATPLLVTARFTPVAISGTMAAVFTGMLLHRLGPAVVMTMALTSFTVGSILSATVPQDQTYWAQVFVTLLVISWGMDMSFPAATLILSDAMAKEHQGIAASLVNTIVNYSISLGLGLAGTVEVHVNKGGKTRADLQNGYHGAQYMGIGLAGLGTVVCCCFLLKEHLDVK